VSEQYVPFSGYKNTQHHIPEVIVPARTSNHIFMSNFLSKLQSTNQSINQKGEKTLKNSYGIYHTILHLFLVHVISTDSDAKQMN